MASGTPLAGMIGLDQVHIWQMTADPSGGTTTYGSTIALPGAAEMNIDPKASQTPYFGDNGLIAIGSTTGFRSISLKLFDIDPQTLGLIFGENYANGQLLDQGTDIQPYFAVAGRVQRNGVNTNTYVVFYKVQFMKMKSDFKTKADKVTFVEVQLDGAIAQLTSNGYYGLAQRSDDPNSLASAITAWFTTVQFPTTDNTALTVVFAAGGTAKTITATFSKASNSGSIPFTMASAQTLLNMAAEILGVKSAAAGAGTALSISWVLTTPGAGFSNNTIVFTGTVNTGATTGDNVTVAVRANSTVQDNNGVSVTAVGKGFLTLA